MTSLGEERSLDPLREYLRKKNSRENLDRFIPNRSAMDFDYARSLLTGGKEWKKSALMSPSSEAYQKLLAEALDMNRSRIMAFKNKPPTPVELFPRSWLSPTTDQSKPTKTCRSIPKSCHRMLEAPDVLDDYHLNLLDWGANNMVAIALSETVYLWNASNGSATELVTFNNEDGPVTSVSWAPDGQRIAIGLQNSHVQLWDFSAQRQLRTFRGGHQLRVGSLAWNSNILTIGGMDCKITNNDVRISSHIVGTYRGHHQEVCGLKWSPSGKQLASGGKDNLLYLWDRSRASLNSGTQWLHRIEAHTATVKAIAWCPFQGNLLASGGSDRCIKFWNTCTGTCLNSVDTGSQVCALLWSKRERELLSSHGLTENQLILWRYPSIRRMAELTGHTSRVLFLAQSPDGCTVASAAADERLMFWQVFGTPEVAKLATNTSSEPFTHWHGIR